LIAERCDHGQRDPDIYDSDVEHGLLSALTEEDRRAVFKTMVRRTYRTGETLFHEGEPGNQFYVIERGRVAIRVSTALGDVATIAVLGAGDSFGEQALLDDSAVRTASAVALEPVEVRTLLRQHFDELRRQNAAVDRLLVEVLAAQVRRLSARLLEALYVPADRRVVRRLAELAVLYDMSAEPLEIPLRQDDLASMAGTTRPTANRILRQLENDGVIALGRGHVQIIDPASLARRAR
jgi:CRP/FNR family transcriptional regulator, cyclic AMP receptor protein